MANESCKERLIERLERAHPGWPEWDALLVLVRKHNFREEECEYLGRYCSCNGIVVFRDDDPKSGWPEWLPTWARALYGMNSPWSESAGGYAESYSDKPPEEGSLFNPMGLDSELGMPWIPVPEGLFPFQSDQSGVMFYIDTRRNVLYPNTDTREFTVLDALENFTRNHLRQVLLRRCWRKGYEDRAGMPSD